MWCFWLMMANAILELRGPGSPVRHHGQWHSAKRGAQNRTVRTTATWNCGSRDAMPRRSNHSNPVLYHIRILHCHFIAPGEYRFCAIGKTKITQGKKHTQSLAFYTMQCNHSCRVYIEPTFRYVFNGLGCFFLFFFFPFFGFCPMIMIVDLLFYCVTWLSVDLIVGYWYGMDGWGSDGDATTTNTDSTHAIGYYTNNCGSKGFYRLVALALAFCPPHNTAFMGFLVWGWKNGRMGLSLDNAAGNHAGINLECFYIDKATLLCITSYIYAHIAYYWIYIYCICI